MGRLPTHAHGQGYSLINFLIPSSSSRVHSGRAPTMPRRATSRRPVQRSGPWPRPRPTEPELHMGGQDDSYRAVCGGITGAGGRGCCRGSTGRRTTDRRPCPRTSAWRRVRCASRRRRDS